MKHRSHFWSKNRSYLLITTLTVASSIVACGGSDSNAAANSTSSSGAGITGSVQVAVPANTGPIPNTAGVKKIAPDGTAIYMLVSSIAAKESGAMIIKSSTPTGIDVMKLIGKSAYEFENVPTGAGATAVIESQSKIKEIMECNSARKNCRVHFFNRINITQISFEVKSDRFYVILP